MKRVASISSVLALLASMLIAVGVGAATTASASCAPEPWSTVHSYEDTAMNPHYSPHYINSGPANNDHQEITFKTLYGYQITRVNSDCSMDSSVMANAKYYSVRNCYLNGILWSCTPWTGWSAITSGVLTCGLHSIQPGGYGCVYGFKVWKNFALTRTTDSRTA